MLSVDELTRLAADWVLAFDGQDEAALQRLNAHYRRAYTLDDLSAEIWRRNYAFRQRSSRVPQNYLKHEEAQLLIAQDMGFASWAALTDAVATGAPGVPPFAIDTGDSRIRPQRQLSDDEWDVLLDAMTEQRLTRLDAGGLMTDGVMARIAALDHVTALSLDGSRQLTDQGLQHLARMPQLEALELTGVKLTDRGLDVLRHLPNLRTFALTWHKGITDAGVSTLKFCDRLERVDLMGSAVGDGAIEALQGKPKLRDFATGRLVTDHGLPLLHNFPLLKNAPATATRAAGDDAPNGSRLLIDGPFTDGGLAALAGLEGVAELDLFWHVTSTTSDGFAHLVNLPQLMLLGADGRLSDDAAMRHIAGIPRLRRLRAQESAATDAGFEALSRCATLESFWGRDCPNFGSRGFLAFSKMPALRGLGVNCKQVDDKALAAFSDFPSLRELTPIGVRDSGFRHIGRCERLERLTCMYCRETTDVATGHIASLQLRYYYAGLTLITDRSLEILGRMSTLEQVEFYEVNGITDAGLPFLAGLPRLREVALDSLPGVTLGGTRVFPSKVRVRYST